ncbi:YwdI family protein [Oceanobacillus halophilus]|uniref:YwdI family protein n=1 Tax=Oceanobacillus halophilus TaxID=930130 RepID=A0A494ZY46_9BACI|nr:YwdI family protein [Oceanobacillus halophilus]RKQ31529.1 hypothetical protein D8M06_13635 [Oceanobacillus halophilus]
MAVSNETILKKMMNELNQAKENEHSQEKMVKHIANVKLLCDLFLEEDPEKETIKEAVKSQTKRDEFSQAELKAMIGDQAVIKNIQEEQTKKKQIIDHEEANGSSIFDF